MNHRINGISKRCKSLTTQSFDAFIYHITVATNADVLFGFVIGNHAFNLNFAVRHIQATTLIYDIDC